MGPTASGQLGPEALAQERMFISHRAKQIRLPGEEASLGLFPTRRRALAFLMSWREADRIFEGTAPPFQRPGSTHWVLRSEPTAALTDAACVALLCRGCQFGRPPDGLNSTIVRQYYLDAP